MSAFTDTLLVLDETDLLAPPKFTASVASQTMMHFDRMSLAQLTLIGAACVLLAGCPSNGSSPASGTSAVTSAPSSGGTAMVTSTTTSSFDGATTSTSTSSGIPGSPPPSGSTGSTTKSVTLSWVAPTLNTDGTILNDLAGYTIDYGTSATAMTQRVTVTGATSTRYTIASLAPGTYYFSVTAYSSAGTQSTPSPTVSKTI